MGFEDGFGGWGTEGLGFYSLGIRVGAKSQGESKTQRGRILDHPWKQHAANGVQGHEPILMGPFKVRYYRGKTHTDQFV